jgi:hypothetical protein
MSDTPNPALALLEFERRIQSASSNREVAFRAVNDGSQVLRFDQAILWRLDVFARPLVAAASGLADVSVDSPYQQWLVRMIQAITPTPFDMSRALPAEQLPEAVVAAPTGRLPTSCIARCARRTARRSAASCSFARSPSAKPSRPLLTG